MQYMKAAYDYLSLGTTDAIEWADILNPTSTDCPLRESIVANASARFLAAGFNPNDTARWCGRKTVQNGRQ